MADKKSKSTYEQLGVLFTGKSGKDLVADCPFCGKTKAFHLNEDKQQWVCSSSPAKCGRSGNHQSFMTQLIEHCLELTDEDAYEELSEARGGLPGAAFRAFSVCQNPQNGEWLIPSWNARGVLQDIRRWRVGKGLQATAGCPTNLWNALALVDPDRKSWPVDICEGEWDGIAWHWLNRSIRRKAVTVALPGTRGWKPEWTELFHGREVRWLFDNDSDGEVYSLKHAKRLMKTVKSQSWLKWPDETVEKYDIRDYVVDTALKGRRRQAFNALMARMVDEHWLDVEQEVAQDRPKKIVRPEKNISFREVVKVLRENLVMSNDMVDAFACSAAVVLSNQMEGDPLWMYLVGPPSSGKTELLMALRSLPDVDFHSTVQAKALVSGFKMNNGQDASLLPKLIGKVAVFKDWTEVIDAHPHEVKAVGGVLRGAYDGTTRRVFGNSLDQQYEGTFSILAGVTKAIHAHNDSSMGERFLKFELKSMSQRRQRHLIDTVIMNTEPDHKRSIRIQEAVNAFLNREIKEPYPMLTPEVGKYLNGLARFTAMMRTQVPWVRDGDGKWLAYDPEPEVGLRLAKQLTKFGRAMAFVLGRKEVDMECYRLMHRVGMNTAEGWPLKVIRTMMLMKTGTSVRNIAAETESVDEGTAGKVLKSMRALKMVDCYKPTKAEREASAIGNNPGRPAEEWKITRMMERLCQEVHFNAED